MNRSMILAAFGAIALALIAVIGMEVTASSDHEIAARTAPEQKAPSAEAGKAKDDTKEDAKDETKDAAKDDAVDRQAATILASDILARPLFAPSRRPPSRAAVADTQDSTLPRLTGIVMVTGLRLAIFQANSVDKPVVVREGGEVAGRKVKAIGPLEVVLTGPQGEERMHPMPDQTLTRDRAPDTPVPRPPQPGSAFGNRPAPPGQAGLPGGMRPPNPNRPPQPQPGRAFVPVGPAKNNP